jgi:hypothetical protein
MMLNPLKPSGNYKYHLLEQLVILLFVPQRVFMGFILFLEKTAVISLKALTN